MSIDNEVNLELVTAGQPDMSGRLLRGYGSGAINRFLRDGTLAETERSNLEQLNRSLQKLNSGQGLIYIANGVEAWEWKSIFDGIREHDPLNSAYIKFWDPQATGPYNSLLFRVNNPHTVFEYQIEKAFTQNVGQSESRDEDLRSSFSRNEDGIMRVRPSLEVALVQRDKPSVTSAASVIWEWNHRLQKVVTKGHVPGRKAVVLDKVPGMRKQEIPLVSFARMRNAVILQAAS